MRWDLLSLCVGIQYQVNIGDSGDRFRILVTVHSIPYAIGFVMQS